MCALLLTTQMIAPKDFTNNPSTYVILLPLTILSLSTYI